MWLFFILLQCTYFLSLAEMLYLHGPLGQVWILREMKLLLLLFAIYPAKSFATHVV